jgi:iron(III) transport system substrate-binding protein
MLSRVDTRAEGCRVFRIVALAVLLTLAGCVPAGAQPPTPAPGSGPVSAGPLSGSGRATWEADWEQTLTAAKREGRVVVSGQPGDAYRLPLTAFEQDYPEIKVEYVGLTAPNFWPRIRQERAAGQYLWDVRIGGPSPQAFEARDEGTLDPVRPLLVLPEVLDDTRWLDGVDGLFADLGKEYTIAFFASESITQFVNRDILSERELPGARDLPDPRFRGKVAMGDPRGGPGSGQLTLLLIAYGEDYVSTLLSKLDTVYTQDLRQLAEWIVRGRYPVAVGLPKYQLDPFQEQGLGRNIKALPGPPGLTNGGGGIQLLNRAPHPNAAKV